MYKPKDFVISKMTVASKMLMIGYKHLIYCVNPQNKGGIHFLKNGVEMVTLSVKALV